MKKIPYVIILSVIAILFLYFFTFHNGLSSDSNEWNNFASYFNGIINPIIMIINVFVFIKLTKAVSDEDRKRTKMQIDVQRDIAIMQLRMQEINTMSSVLNGAFVPNASGNSILEKGKPIVFALSYIECFVTSKLTLFSLNKESETTKKIEELLNKMNAYYYLFNKKLPIEKQTMIDLLTVRSEVLNSLQNITINDRNIYNIFKKNM